MIMSAFINSILFICLGAGFQFLGITFWHPP